MFLRTNVTNRRQFLGRSALGAGSLLFGPLLLESCTDHNIPDPSLNPPVIPRYDLSAPLSIDWNDALKTVTVAGLSEIPVVGGFLSPLADILWPGESQPNVWDQIKDKVEALVNKDIDSAVYSLVSAQLSGLESSIGIYKKALAENDPVNTTSNWINIVYSFSNAKGYFQNPDYALLLLPLFVQYATLYLSVLRDPVVAAHFVLYQGYNSPIQFNRTDSEISDDVSTLQNAISEFTNYTVKTFDTGFLALGSSDSSFNTLNAFSRQMVLLVFDYMDTWKYYDYMTYPYGSVAPYAGPALVPQNIFSREIYSDAYGYIDGPYGTFYPTSPGPTQFPTQIKVWGYDRIDAVQVYYPQNGGPNNQSDTGRMGDQPDGNGGGGTTEYPYGGVFYPTTNNPITQARTRYGQFIPQRNVVPTVYTLQFAYYNGTLTQQMGGANWDGTQTGDPDSGWVSYPDHALSSVYIRGIAPVTNSARSIVFGFIYWQAPAVTLNAIRVLYVKSPIEKSHADYAKAFPKLVIPADLINDELKEIRRKYWAYVKAKK